LWRYRLKLEDLPERLIKRARKKRDEKLENKRATGENKTILKEEEKAESLEDDKARTDQKDDSGPKLLH
jgi:hypothetical protein